LRYDEISNLILLEFFCRVRQLKNFENRSTFGEVIRARVECPDSRKTKLFLADLVAKYSMCPVILLFICVWYMCICVFLLIFCLLFLQRWRAILIERCFLTFHHDKTNPCIRNGFRNNEVPLQQDS